MQKNNMTKDQVEFTIRWMRITFVVLGIILIPVALFTLAGSMHDANYLLAAVIEIAIGYCFYMAFRELGARNESGYRYAQISSVILLFGFPIFTLPGAIYLYRLNKKEMKKAFGVKSTSARTVTKAK